MVSPARRIKIDTATTIEATPAELYAFWRDFENVPRFMRHIVSVRMLDERRSEWTAIARDGSRISWRTEITEDRPNERIGWRSLSGSAIEQRGSVRFVPAPESGTEVHLSIAYVPPIEAEGMQEDLRCLKQLYETGSIPTIEGQPRGGRAREVHS